MYLFYVHIQSIQCIIIVSFYCFFIRMSASCTHVLELLHALVAATFIEFTIRPTSSVSNLEEDLPVLLNFANGRLLKTQTEHPLFL